MSDKLTPELFREAFAAKAKIVSSLDKASDIQLYTAACILAKIRISQGATVPFDLYNQDLERLGSVPSMNRGAVLEYLLGA